jgi:hypothetical protein
MQKMLACSACQPYVIAFPLSGVEVFQTNVRSPQLATTIIQALQNRFIGLKATFDLEDCDRVLRVQSPYGEPALWARVVALVRGFGVQIEVLPE